MLTRPAPIQTDSRRFTLFLDSEQATLRLGAALAGRQGQAIGSVSAQ